MNDGGPTAGDRQLADALAIYQLAPMPGEDSYLRNPPDPPLLAVRALWPPRQPHPDARLPFDR